MSKSVIITGATGGIGKALCEAFSASGYYVIGTDLAGGCDNVDDYYSMDLLSFVNNQEERNNFLTFVDNSLNGRMLVGLINNAAIQIIGEISNISADSFKDSLAINVTAPFLLLQLLLPRLSASNGSVINIGSIHTKATKPKFLAYSTSKSALLGLTQAAAVDLGGRVRVNSIQPAATATEMLLEGFNDSSKLDELKSYHPVGRIAEPSEIANVAVFLVSDKAGFITGASICMDGGIGIRLHDPE